MDDSSAGEIQEQDTNDAQQASTANPRDPDGQVPQDSPVSMMGGSGLSLDGRSFVVPMDREFDDVSSINTAQYGYGHEMRIVGSAEDEENGEYTIPMESSPIKVDRRTQQPSFEYHSPYPKRDEKSMGTSGSYDTGCLPLWISDAPKWLKIVIILSTALLVGAIVLIGVGAALAVQKDSDSLQSSFSGPTFTPSNAPITAPTSRGSSAPVAPVPVAEDGNGDVVTPPTAAPTVTTLDDNLLTQSPAASSVSFFVTGGRFTGDSLVALPQQLATLPTLDGNAVMFHLGDWNSPFATSCVEQSYQDYVDLYSNSAVPVYFVPGDNEYNGEWA